MKEKPRVMSFVDYRLFLQAWYEYHKQNTPGFSFGTWTTQCQFKSRSYIRSVMLGKRNLTTDSVQKILKSLKLNHLEAEYFEHMVLYANATNFHAKEYHFQQIVTLCEQKTGNEVCDIFKFLSNPKTPRVHLLLSLKNLNCTEEFVAETFDITKTEAREILQNIQDCGLATFDSQSGSWRSTNKNLTIPEELGNTGIQSFHSNSLKEALEAINLSPQERHFDSMALTLTSAEFAEMKADLNQFFNYISKKYTSQILDGARVCQININLIPASEALQEVVHPRSDFQFFTSPLENAL